MPTNVKVRHSPAISTLSTRGYETLDYIAIDDTRDDKDQLVRDVARKWCYERPDLIIDSQQLVDEQLSMPAR